MRVHLNDPSLIANLLAYLRHRECVVDQIGSDVLAVWCPPSDHASGGEHDVMCRSCGTPIAETLGRLGSLRCHDCRDEGAFGTLVAGVYGHANANGHAASARGRLAGYLAAWHVEHPGAVASLID